MASTVSGFWLPDMSGLKNLPGPRMLAMSHYLCACYGLVCGMDDDSESLIKSLARKASDELAGLLAGVRAEALLPYVNAWSVMQRIGYGHTPSASTEIVALQRIVSDIALVPDYVAATALARLYSLMPDRLTANELHTLTDMIDRFTEGMDMADLRSEQSLRKIIFLASLHKPLATDATRKAVRTAFDKITRLDYSTLPTASLALINTLSGFMGQPDTDLLHMLAERHHPDPLTAKAYGLELSLIAD